MTLPAVAPPLPPAVSWDRHMPRAVAFGWLQAGWRDFTIQPVASISYGVLVFLVSAAIVGGLFAFGWDYILFPAFAGFMVVGPVLAIGLYEKSRLIASGKRVSLLQMILVRPASGGQVLFAGVLLCTLMLVWTRAAVIIYALFFGINPFPGLGGVAAMLFTTPVGWAMLIAGSFVGGIFAAFSFAISVFAIPMLLNERVDALTAMGTSMGMVWANLPVMLTWAAIALALFLINVMTGLVAMIVVFPVLGHGTWHAYMAMKPGVEVPGAT
jgi:uncharacterized membrane protein